MGEQTNILTGYLAAVSRKLEKPLAVIVQSTSAAGKTSLMEAVLAMMPSEERVKYSALTGQALYYLGETNLKNKILAIVEEEGAEKASYALKLLQSEGELTIASTTKDDKGKLITEQYRVEGPVMIFLTTTAIDIDEELLNRCLILTVDESRRQTEAIHRLQRSARTWEGIERKEEAKRIRTVHQNAQRLLKPLPVINPYADQLTFMSERTRTRRDHEKYLTLIDIIALLHQHQRPLKQRNGLQAIEVQPSDIAAANQIAHEVLGRSLDQLPPQTRRLLMLLKNMVAAMTASGQHEQRHCLFSRRQVREFTGLGNTQLKIHLARLVDMEYLALRTNPNHSQGYLYQLLFDGEDNATPRMSGLIDIATLVYDENRSGQNGNRSGGGRPLVGPRSGGGRGGLIASEASNNGHRNVIEAQNSQNAQPAS